MRRAGAALAAFLLLTGVASAAARTAGRRAAGRPGGPRAAETDPQLNRHLSAALRVPHVSRARSSAVAVDLRTGEELFALNESLPLAPASNEKLALTFALLKTFSPKLRLATRVFAAGRVEGATLRGSLALVGGGDPSLSSSDLRRLARSVRAAGIVHVTGGVLGDESLFDSQRTCLGWKTSFYKYESPPLSALVVDRGFYRSYIATRPAKAAALLFRDALRRAGVTVDGGVAVRRAPADAVLVAQSLSAPLARLVAFMDIHSDNFTAEELLKYLSLVRSGVGTSAGGAQAVMRVLEEEGIPVDGVRIVDGSGLSQKDRLTTAALVGILQAVEREPAIGAIVVHALPVAGVSGTLKDRMRTPLLLGHVRAKTGTTDIASSLSGLVNGHIAFAIIQNGNPLAYWWAREAQDRFATVLARQG
jgi:D-alanyl-D-alanine carboxypeptidase/D-alanyl-D-alanine-endopeptidase (penicillin-binding protein 4)